MGMFDWFEPDAPVECPVCGGEVTGWQGKDGPCALLVWRQGDLHPVDQRVDADVRSNAEELRGFALPPTFGIVATCTNDHLCFAECRVVDGVWVETAPPTAQVASRRSLTPRSTSPSADLLLSPGNGFVRTVVAAFEPIVAELDFVLHDVVDTEWFAAVTWRRGTVLLRVSDDRRDRLIDVTLLRPDGWVPTPDESSLVRGDVLGIPLWAIVESLGGSADFAAAGEHRLDRLSAYVDAVRQYAIPFIVSPREPISGVAEVVRRRNWESSEEGRAKHRFLP